MKSLTYAIASFLALLAGSQQSALAADDLPEPRNRAGSIRVLKTTGEVSSVERSTGNSAPLAEGSFLKQDHSITTGKDSSAILLLSTGTKITLRPDTEFVVETFTQAPFDLKEVNFSKSRAEPSVSAAKFSVIEGTILADVAKLSKGSTFEIVTPTGVISVRGTIVSITVSRPTGNSRTVTVDLPEGTIDFSSIDGKSVTLSNGMTISFSLAGGTLTPSDITPLSPQRTEELMSLVDQALELIPTENAFEGVEDGSPQQPGSTNDDQAGGFGGDQGAGTVGTAPTGGSGGGGDQSSGNHGGNSIITPVDVSVISPSGG